MTLGDLRQYVKVRPPQFLSVRKHTHFLHTRCYRVHILCMFPPPPKPVHLPPVHTMAIVWNDWPLYTYRSQFQESILPILEEGHSVEPLTFLQLLNSIWNIFTDLHVAYSCMLFLLFTAEKQTKRGILALSIELR